jgi:hypothetical protein
VPTAWLNTLIGAATRAVKKYCKFNLELENYVEEYDGHRERKLVLRQAPLWVALTTVDQSMNGLTLPQATINVASTVNFPPGTGGATSTLSLIQPPTLCVQTGSSSYAAVTYTGVTPNPGSPTASASFTGCSGGTGTLKTGYTVSTPAVWIDPNAYGGQASGAFPDTLLLAPGSQFMVPTDGRSMTRSEEATLLRVGGQGAAFVGSYPETLYRGKLGGQHLPEWPLGNGNIKVAYTAGYYPIPDELSYATAMLVAQMVRIMPSGTDLSSESLGAYSYSVLQANADMGPELGSIRRVLASFRDIVL